MGAPAAAGGGFFNRGGMGRGLLGGLAAGFLGAGLFGMLFGGGLFSGLGGLSSILGLLAAGRPDRAGGPAGDDVVAAPQYARDRLCRRSRGWPGPTTELPLGHGFWSRIGQRAARNPACGL